MLSAHDIERHLNSKVHFGYTEVLFYKSKINSYGVYVAK